jgi:hypothetical protein
MPLLALWDVYNVLTSSGGSTGFPINFLSCHSNTTKLTIGSSPSGMFSGFINLVRMKGSTLPPQPFLEYMPEHTCRFASFWFWCNDVQLLRLAVFDYSGMTYHHILCCMRSGQKVQ